MSKVTKKQLQRDINNLATELTNLKIELLEKKVISDEPKPQLKQLDQSVFPLIERDTAKELLEVDLSSELTGSDLCRAMLARGDYHVMCAVSDISESDAMLSCNSAVITSGEIRGAFTNSFDGLHEHAVPINNQGEPLTQAEAGL